MSSDERLLAVFDDLEQQADGLALLDRDAAVAELSRAAYAEVDLGSRLHGALGTQVTLGIRGVGLLSGLVVRAGRDFVLLESAESTWAVRSVALTRVSGVPDTALSPEARSLPARVGLGSVLRGYADDAAELALHDLDGEVLHGRVRRVGADFVEIVCEGAGQGRVLLPFGGIAALRRSPHRG